MSAKVIEATNDPLEYPWKRPETSVLIKGFSDDGTSIEECKLKPLKNRRIGFAQVSNGYSIESFDSIAQTSHHEWSEYRYPVVAIGSNASPEVMVNKFRRRNEFGSRYFPIVKARIHNIGIGYFGTITSRGYIAATPFGYEGGSSEVWVSWLTLDQFNALNSTEPGYTCRFLDGAKYPLEILSENEAGQEVVTESLASYYLYDSDTGYLVDPIADEPLLLDANSLQNQAAAFVKIREIAEKLGSVELQSLFSGTSREIQQRFSEAENPDGVAAARTAIIRFTELVNELGLVRQPNLESLDGLQIRTGESGYFTRDQLRMYRTIESISRPEPDAHGPWYLVKPSRDNLDRSSHVAVVLPKHLQTQYGSTVGVRSGSAEGFMAHTSFAQRPAMLAQAHYVENLAEGVVELDQTVRDGLGVGVHEYVQVVLADAPQSRVADFIVPKRFLTMRAFTSDHTNMETGVAQVTTSTMSILGIPDSSELVIEGAPQENGAVPVVRLRAAVMSDEVLARHKELTNAHVGLYASPRSYLGVHSEIAPILLDRSIRTALNLGNEPLGVLRVRASRRARIISELRELMLVVFIAFLGLVTMIPNPNVALGATGALVLIALFLTLSRVRSAIGKTKLTNRAARRSLRRAERSRNRIVRNVKRTD